MTGKRCSAELRTRTEWWVLYSKDERGEYECLKRGFGRKADADAWKEANTHDGVVEKVEVYC